MMNGSQVFTQSLPKSVAFISPQYQPRRAIQFSPLVDSEGTPLTTTLSSTHEHDTYL